MKNNHKKKTKQKQNDLDSDLILNIYLFIHIFSSITVCIIILKEKQKHLVIELYFQQSLFFFSRVMKKFKKDTDDDSYLQKNLNFLWIIIFSIDFNLFLFKSMIRYIMPRV